MYLSSNIALSLTRDREDILNFFVIPFVIYLNTKRTYWDKFEEWYLKYHVSQEGIML